MAFHLARFIENVRGLSSDAIVLRQEWLRAYDFTTDRGAAALNDHARVDEIAALDNEQPAKRYAALLITENESP
ncbi:hypothetical protein ACH79_26965 [Bradyrhizobium sp. CCBAU 051011]|nr:hypothetical protein ACH79_26965 [Bradyrhizobium sp. CCBAU 051011]